jgi:hypothetical protein
MAKMITVTEVGGAYFGPQNNTPRTINADEVKSLDNPMSDELGTTKIIFKDGKSLYVTETEAEITKKINGEPQRSWFSRLFGK